MQVNNICNILHFNAEINTNSILRHKKEISDGITNYKLESVENHTLGVNDQSKLNEHFFQFVKQNPFPSC
jgi:hypothetical protein